MSEPGRLDALARRIADGRCDLVIDYLAAGGEAGDGGSAGVPLVRWCAYYGDVAALRILLGAGATLDALGPNLDLNGAAFHGHWRLCEFLLDAGADPNAALPNGETPLHAALSKAGRPQDAQIVALLLARGADPDAATVPGLETGAFMRDARTRGETPLHRAAAFGSAEAVRLLVDAGADKERRDAFGDSPLAWASWHLRPSAMIRLLCFGEHALRPDAEWTGDHGAGGSALDRHLLGRRGDAP